MSKNINQQIPVNINGLMLTPRAIEVLKNMQDTPKDDIYCIIEIIRKTCSDPDRSEEAAYLWWLYDLLKQLDINKEIV